MKRISFVCFCDLIEKKSERFRCVVVIKQKYWHCFGCFLIFPLHFPFLHQFFLDKNRCYCFSAIVSHWTDILLPWGRHSSIYHSSRNNTGWPYAALYVKYSIPLIQLKEFPIKTHKIREKFTLEKKKKKGGARPQKTVTLEMIYRTSFK